MNGLRNKIENLSNKINRLENKNVDKNFIDILKKKQLNLLRVYQINKLKNYFDGGLYE